MNEKKALDWLETNIQKRFPDGERLDSGRIRLRVFIFCLSFMAFLKRPPEEQAEPWISRD